MAMEYQDTEKARRVRKHNESLRGQERGTARETGQTVTPSDEQPATGALTEDSDRVLRRLRSRSGAAYDCIWNSSSTSSNSLTGLGTDFTPLCVSRLKMVEKFGDRPSARLAQDVNEDTPVDFDEELLQEIAENQTMSRAILDGRTLLSTTSERSVREFKVKWVGCDDPMWEPASNLSCGGLILDYLREKRRDRRLHIVQVADDD
ncbi:hypothetical protein PHMEG_00025028 [Phytophthora megakarya]|uniref:Chromo domain-containing protein n=1 Tax=Phytophthora megakarya TaxID=4795 RepID=A0A225VD25_9STRA|nr:hypothetical protein PHMEG_00025028 [Phytophthora megakarya]